MSLDLSQFVPAFLEESMEGLDLIESSLLHLDEGDSDTLNAIFRAAHSIKGGAGTFGFADVVGLTHLVETLLDELRSNERALEQPLIDLLLQSTDCIRVMLSKGKDADADDHARRDQISQQLLAVLSPQDAAPSEAAENTALPETASDNSPQTELQGWHIDFLPKPELLQSGNDPVYLINALRSLGTLTFEEVDLNLPDLEGFDPETIYLAWHMTLQSDCSEADIREIFEWVEDDCLLNIHRIGADLTAQAADVSSATDSTPSDITSSAISAAAEISAPLPAAETASISQTPAATTAAPSTVAEPSALSDADKLSQALKAKTSTAAKVDAGGSIRVAIDKVDTLINRVGELVITQSMLSQISHDMADLEHPALEKMRAGLAMLERNMRDLQEEVMRIRMLPIGSVFNRFPRLVHDVSRQLGKRIELRMQGEHTELDKTVLEKIGDPLVHLIRNALDHGLEMPDEREAAGKSPVGLVELSAFHLGGHIMIVIKDDGRGLNTSRIREKAIEKGLVGVDQVLSDHELKHLIFLPGFSTANTVSDLSGRGVGMDVVKRNIEALGGDLNLQSELGQGTSIHIRLPLTLAIMDGQLVRVNDQIYIIPLIAIVESIQIDDKAVKNIAGQDCLYHFRNEYIPLVDISLCFGLGTHKKQQDPLLVVVDAGGRKFGLLVDELLSQQQVVLKNLESNFKKVSGIEGATILGDGNVALIIDIPGLCRAALDGSTTSDHGATYGKVVA